MSDAVPAAPLTTTAPAADAAAAPAVTDLQGILDNYGLPAITVILILLVAVLISGWVSRVITASARAAKLEETIAIFFGRLGKWAVLTIALIMCLNKFGVNTASLAAVIAAAGFAIGLAFQGTLSNFSSGVMLLVFRPFKVGDYIKVSGQEGVVKEVDLFTCSLDTVDNRRIIMPNSVIFGATIENVTHHSARRCDVTVGVAYKEDLAATRKVLMEALLTVADRDPEQEPIVVLKELAASSVDWHLRIWTTPTSYWAVRESMLEAVKRGLDKAGLSIPFPQLDVHLDKPEA
jgi:small conductance mechanosensitive channel